MQVVGEKHFSLSMMKTTWIFCLFYKPDYKHFTNQQSKINVIKLLRDKVANLNSYVLFVSSETNIHIFYFLLRVILLFTEVHLFCITVLLYGPWDVYKPLNFSCFQHSEISGSSSCKVYI